MNQFFPVNRIFPVTLSCILIIFPGCASVSVGNIHHKGTPPGKLPEKIVVQEFIAPYDNFRVDREGKELDTFIHSEQHALGLALVEQLTKYIAPASLLPGGKSLPKKSGENIWRVRGTFEEVNQGSRLLRAGVGFGAGKTKMETRAEVDDLSSGKPVEILSMVTTGGSGLTPGAWAAFTPAMAFYWPGAIANAGGGVISGLSADRNRTAREITAALSEYCFQHGLIPESRTRRPKHLGSLPSLQRPDFLVPKTGL